MTRAQREVLDIYQTFAARAGRPPTIREVARIRGCSSPASTHYIAQRMVRAGYLRRVGKQLEPVVDRCQRCGK